MTNFELVTYSLNNLSRFIGTLQMGATCNSCPGNKFCIMTGCCNESIKKYLQQNVNPNDEWINELPDKICEKTDPYLQPDTAYNRLEDEFKKYGKLIIAVDYDDTLYDFHKKGRTYNDVMNLLKRWEPYSEVIIFTGNGESDYPKIKEYLNNHNIKFKGINCQSSVPNKNTGKVYANVYLDNRIGLRQVFDELSKLITKIENKEVIYHGC